MPSDIGRGGDDCRYRLERDLRRAERTLQALRNSVSFNLGRALVLLPRHPIAASRHLRVVFAQLTRRSEARMRAWLPARQDPLVSVVMTTFNSAGFVDDAVQSVLSQSYRRLELIVVDDASTDGTFEHIRQRWQHDPRLKLVKALDNRGTYYCKNLGLTMAAGEYVTFQDSDDTSDRRRIAKQVAVLEADHTLVAATCNYVRRASDGRLVSNRGLEQRKAIMVPMIRVDVLRGTLGFFDSVRIGADEELYRRMRSHFGDRALAHVDEPLYTARHREGSLTTTSDTLVELSVNAPADDPFGHLSPVRREYSIGFQEFHRAVATAQRQPYVEFPQRARPFDAPSSILPRSTPPCPVVACLASMPTREGTLEEVIDTLLPQVDGLYVYLNGHARVPSFLDDPRIQVATSAEKGDRADNGKFHFIPELSESFVLTVDDDIRYPPDYVQRMILKVEQYDRRAVVGVHGVMLAEPLVRFYKDRYVIGFQKACDLDEFVELLGTGTVAFHTDTLALLHDDFRDPGMADLWFAVAARRARVPLVSIARPAQWLQPLSVPDDGIFERSRNSDDAHTEIARANGPWGRAALLDVVAPLGRDLLAGHTEHELLSREVHVDVLNQAVASLAIKGTA